jgi:host factor-I protein
MAVEFNTGLPSFRYVQGLIRDQKEAEILLLNNERLTGTLFWQDHECLCLKDASGQQTVIWRQAIAYIKGRS